MNFLIVDDDVPNRKLLHNTRKTTNVQYGWRQVDYSTALEKRLEKFRAPVSALRSANAWPNR